MKHRDLRYFCLALAVTFCVAFIGCSGGNANKLTDISGLWKGNNDGTMIEINLVGEQNFLKIGDKTVEATIKSVQDDLISLVVKADNGQTEKWTLMQVWNDNGSAFDLALNQNGTRDKLTLIKKL
jgi:hypothetical protein